MLLTISEKDMELCLKYHRDMVLLLTELKERRNKSAIEEAANRHTPMTYAKGHPVKKKGKTVDPGITEVTCSCGFVTKYKKGLLDLEDFECPRKRR